MSELLLEARGLCKDFGSVRVLHNVNFSLRPGEIHAVIGENGAGKSTLVKIIAGFHQATSGQLLLRGQPVKFSSIGEAEQAGIVLIHQEFNLANDLTVEENIFLGREITRGPLLDKQEMRRRSAEVLRSLHTEIDPTTRVKSLSVSDKQMVEIAKAMSRNADILIMDEPTAVLTTSEVEVLFALMRKLQEQGVAIIYISHKLAEVKKIADRVTVLRDGHQVATAPVEELTEDDMARLMVGRELSDMFPQKSGPAINRRPVLEVENLSSPGAVERINFTLYEGEVLGFAGLVGAGRTELMEALVGLRHRSSGAIRLFGESVNIREYQDAVNLGMVYLTEDRKGKGLLTRFRLRPNLTLLSLRSYVAKLGLIDTQREQDALQTAVKDFAIRTPSLDATVEMLSGGNQQKLALGKIMEIDPQVIILDEPTRGIDVGTKQQIYFFIRELIQSGKSCIVVSSELPEIVGLCDRVIVMRSGRVSGEVAGELINEEEIMLYATGVKGVSDIEGNAHAHAGR